ncbi:uncharacterized protein [Miscanthus floridulus]|uniref:uncharacterized protein n=1 Tax=Miscanthus floridulus TaxID=154761 RepID=UPI0034584A9B
MGGHATATATTVVEDEGRGAEAIVSPFEPEAPTLAPLKALKEPVAQGEATEAATKQAGEEAPMPREARALESGEAEAPSITEATEGEVEAHRTSKAKVAEAGASRAFEAKVADVEAPRTTEAEVAEAGAPGTSEAEVVEAGLGAVEPVAQDAETEVGQASVLPPVQDPPPSQESTWEVEVHSISSDDTSRGKEVVDAEELEAWSLEKSMFLQRERDVWDQLQ